MAEKKKQQMCIALLGKTGNGKSSTANTLLQDGEQHFLVKSQTTSVTKIVRCGKTTINNETLIVYDTHGEAFEAGSYKEDRGKTEDELKFNDLKRSVSYVEALLRDSDSVGDVCAFLMVVRYGARFTTEEKSSFDMYKKLFGPNLLSDYGILVLTFGDLFEEEEGNTNVLSWCRSQDGSFKDIFDECKERVVLMFNKSQDGHLEQQRMGVEAVVRYACQLRSERLPYNWDNYEQASKSRTDIYLQYESITLTPGFENELKKLKRELESPKRKFTETKRNELLIRIGILKGLIDEKRKGRQLYTKLLDDLNDFEKHVSSVKTCVIF